MRDAGCQHGQGYQWGLPTAFEELLEQCADGHAAWSPPIPATRSTRAANPANPASSVSPIRSVLAVDADDRPLVLVRRPGATEWTELPGFPLSTIFQMGLTVDPSGRVTMVGTTRLDVWVATWTDAGGWRLQRVGPADGRELVETRPVARFAASPAGDVAVAWKDSAAGSGSSLPVAVVAYRGREETKFGPPEVFKPATSCPYGNPCIEIGMADDGELTAAWSDDAASGGEMLDLRLARRDPATGDWSDSEMLLTRVPRYLYFLYGQVLAVAPDGTAVVDAVADSAGDTRRHVFRCSRGSSCEPPTLLSTPSTTHDPTHSVGPAGSAVLLWGDGCSGGEACWYRYIRARTLAPLG